MVDSTVPAAVALYAPEIFRNNLYAVFTHSGHDSDVEYFWNEVPYAGFGAGT